MSMSKSRERRKKAIDVYHDAENTHPNTYNTSIESPVSSEVSEPNSGWRSVKSITPKSPQRRTPLGTLHVANKTPEGREVFFTSVDSISPYAASPLESSPSRMPLDQSKEGLRGKALKRRAQRRPRQMYHDSLPISSESTLEEEEESPIYAYKRPVNPMKAGAVAIVIGIVALCHQYGERIVSLWHQRNTRLDQVSKLADTHYEWVLTKTSLYTNSVQTSLYPVSSDRSDISAAQKAADIALGGIRVKASGHFTALPGYLRESDNSVMASMQHSIQPEAILTTKTDNHGDSRPVNVYSAKKHKRTVARRKSIRPISMGNGDPSVKAVISPVDAPYISERTAQLREVTSNSLVRDADAAASPAPLTTPEREYVATISITSKPRPMNRLATTSVSNGPELL